MAYVDIVIYPDPVLRQKADPIEKVDGEILKLIDDMVDTMYGAPGTGIGLAANQIGRPVRLVVIDLRNPEYKQGLMVLVNPEIVACSGETTSQEGCLSLPDYFSNIKRYAEVTVRALDKNEQPFEIKASGLLAVVLQHEIDHLDGKLFIDYLGPISRDLFRRKWKKRLKEVKA